jgi:hypothetical protein
MADENEPCGKTADAPDPLNDPVLQMRGLGKEIWADTNADDYVANLRAGRDEEGA